MQIQINSDNVINLGEAGISELTAAVSSRLERFAERLTRVEVHFSDINGSENHTGDDKRCLIEARPAGREPVAVTDEATSLDAALNGALHKVITALERDFGRLNSRKGH